MILPTTIQARIVLTALATTHTATVAPPFATDVLLAHEPLQIQAPAKQLACPARVDVTKHKRVKTSVRIVRLASIKPTMGCRIVCLAFLALMEIKLGQKNA